MQQALSVDVRDGQSSARVTVTGEVTPRSWATLRRTLEDTAAMYSVITLDLSRVTRLDGAVLPDLAEARRWLRSRDGRLDVVRMPPAGRRYSQPPVSFLGLADSVAPGDRRSFTGTMKEHDEAQAVALVSIRLRERFPGVSRETIDEVVSGYLREYDGKPIRDFVPILVERQARDHLRTIPRQRAGAADDRP
jgi:ABC-type transporter Mla MlaB component